MGWGEINFKNSSVKFSTMRFFTDGSQTALYQVTWHWKLYRYFCVRRWRKAVWWLKRFMGDVSKLIKLLFLLFHFVEVSYFGELCNYDSVGGFSPFKIMWKASIPLKFKSSCRPWLTRIIKFWRSDANKVF